MNAVLFSRAVSETGRRPKEHLVSIDLEHVEESLTSAQSGEPAQEQLQLPAREAPLPARTVLLLENSRPAVFVP
jgi:hypothetical protein